jgi:hypothetical protein
MSSTKLTDAEIDEMDRKSVVCPWIYKTYNFQDPDAKKYLFPVGRDRDEFIAEIANGNWTEWEDHCNGQDLRDIYWCMRGVENPLGRKHTPGLNSKSKLIDWIDENMKTVRKENDMQNGN